MNYRRLPKSETPAQKMDPSSTHPTITLFTFHFHFPVCSCNTTTTINKSIMAEEFAHEVMKQSVARTCVALGYSQASPECLECMADVVGNFISTLGQKTTEIAETAGRFQPGFQDVILSCGALVSMRRFFCFVWFCVYLEWWSFSGTWLQLERASRLCLRGCGQSCCYEPQQSLYSMAHGAQQSGPTLKWNQPFPHEVPSFPMRTRSAAASSSSSYSSTVSNGKQKKGSRSLANVPPATMLLDSSMIENGGNNEAKERKKYGIPDHCIPLPPDHVYKHKIAKHAKDGNKTVATLGGSKRKQAQQQVAEEGAFGAMSEKQQKKKRIASIQANRDSLTKIESAFDAATS
jgi:histone H3/H4